MMSCLSASTLPSSAASPSFLSIGTCGTGAGHAMPVPHESWRPGKRCPHRACCPCVRVGWLCSIRRRRLCISGRVCPH